MVAEDSTPTQGRQSGNSGNRLRQLIASNTAGLDALCRQADVVVLAGPRIAERSLGDCATPTLLLFTPRQKAEAIAATHRGPVAAIYREADPILNLQLIKQALPSVATVAVPVTPADEVRLARLQAEAKRLGFTLLPVTASNDEEVVHRLHPRLADFDALMLLPGERLINGWSLKPILLMTVRRGLPVFGGLDESYVKAGVTAAVVQDREQAGPQIERYLRELAQGNLPESTYPESIRIAVNEWVARNLSLKLDMLAGDGH